MKTKMWLNRSLLIFGIGAASIICAPAAAVAAEETGHEHHQQMDHSDHKAHKHHRIYHDMRKGSWMFEYQFMRMDMNGLLIGKNNVSPNDPRVLGTMMNPGPYMMAPSAMTMDMHMLMGMYGFTDNLSGMLMANYNKNKMDMVNRMGQEQFMETDGAGDTLLGAIYRVTPNWMGSLGLTIPTGSIDEKVKMTMGGNTTERQAAYAMQLGSGTYDLIPAVIYKRESEKNAWGSSLEYTYRIGDNDNSYNLGDEWELSAWLIHQAHKNILLTMRFDYLYWNKIQGEDDKIPATMMTSSGYMASTDDPNNYGGRRLDGTFGVVGSWGPSRLAFQIGMPFYQNLNGPQMETDFIYSLGYQFMIM